MRKIIVLALALGVSACADDRAPTAPDNAAADAALAPAGGVSDAYAPGRILAKFRPGADEARLAAAHGAAIDRDLVLGIRVLSVPVGREVEISRALSRSPGVEFAEPDFARTFGDLVAPGDEFFGYKWDLHNDGTINNSSGQQIATTGQVDADIDWLEAFDQLGQFTGGATLGIMDTGIRASHEDLAGRVVAQYDFHDDDPNAADDHGHGTHVAGIATAYADNEGMGVAGVAYGPNVELAIAKVCGPIQPPLFGQNYGCYSSNTAAGITWAVDNGAHVLNLSLGGTSASSAEQQALQYARSNNVLPFCAAGNSGGNADNHYPSAFPECVAVSATDWGDDLASYSNFGSTIELSAPGGDTEDSNGYSYIASSYYEADDSYALMAGTSMASPQAAGLATLLHALGTADDDDKLARMKSTADDLGAAGTDEQFGAGRINVFRAIGGTPSDDGGTTNSSPTASFTQTCADLSCDFDGSGSSDSDGSIASYDWDFGDGTTGSGVTVSHTYAAGGTYTVTLTVTDDDGATGSDSQDVTVSESDTGTEVTVTAIDPNTVQAGSSVDVTITGTGFQAGADVSLESGSGPNPSVSNVVVVDSTSITATISTKSGGPPRNREWDVRVTNPDSSTGVLVAGFTVTP